MPAPDACRRRACPQAAQLHQAHAQVQATAAALHMLHPHFVAGAASPADAQLGLQEREAGRRLKRMVQVPAIGTGSWVAAFQRPLYTHMNADA